MPSWINKNSPQIPSEFWYIFNPVCMTSNKCKTRNPRSLKREFNEYNYINQYSIQTERNDFIYMYVPTVSLERVTYIWRLIFFFWLGILIWIPCLVLKVSRQSPDLLLSRIICCFSFIRKVFMVQINLDCLLLFQIKAINSVCWQYWTCIRCSPPSSIHAQISWKSSSVYIYIK